jgi:hypothetical protein
MAFLPPRRPAQFWGRTSVGRSTCLTRLPLRCRPAASSPTELRLTGPSLSSPPSGFPPEVVAS